MAIIRVVFFFRQELAGWTETWHIDRESLTSALTEADGLRTIRRQLGHPDCHITHVRANFVSTPNQTLIRRYFAPKLTEGGIDTPWQAILLRIETETGTRRMQAIRGVPDSYFLHGELHSSGELAIKLASLEATLANFGWKIRSIAKANPVLTVTDVSGDGVVTTSVAHNLSPGHKVKFYRTRDTLNRLVSGNFDVIEVPTATTFRIGPWKAGRLVDEGKVRRQEIVYTDVARLNAVRAMSRRPGRPFGLLVGRRSRPALT